MSPCTATMQKKFTNPTCAAVFLVALRSVSSQLEY